MTPRKLWRRPLRDPLFQLRGVSPGAPPGSSPAFAAVYTEAVFDTPSYEMCKLAEIQRGLR